MESNEATKGNILYQHYPLVFPGGEKPAEWNTPMTNSLDRFLREVSDSPETRDILRALIRNRRPYNGTETEASDDMIQDWTGIDAANVARRLRLDAVFRYDVKVRRGQRRRPGLPGVPTVYDLTNLFASWAAFNSRQALPPSAEMIEQLVAEYAARRKRTMAWPVIRSAVEKALVDAQAALDRPLQRSRTRDVRRVLERAIELAFQTSDAGSHFRPIVPALQAQAAAQS